MARLELEAEAARQPHGGGRLDPEEVVSYLQKMPVLWAGSGPAGRQALATALFTKMEVLGTGRWRSSRSDVRSGSVPLSPSSMASGVSSYSSLVGARGENLQDSRFCATIDGARERDRAAEGLARRLPKGRMTPTQRPTRRQLEVLRAYIAAGSIATAAYELGISETTARQHLSGLYRRTGCLNVAQAAYWLGLIDHPSGPTS